MVAHRYVRLFPRERMAVRDARVWIDGVASEYVDADQREAARLVLAELIWNAVEQGAGEPLVVEIAIREDRVKLSVTDPAGTLAEPTDEIGGNVLRHLAERWQVFGTGHATGIDVTLRSATDDGTRPTRE